jgi:hypothetical protein
MPADVRSYLAEVRSHLHLDAHTSTRVISELESHFQDKVGDLRAEGLQEHDAVDEAIASFGEARDVARLMYEAYSRGTWTEALVSFQPHILVAFLFATHLWREPFVLSVAFGAIALLAIMGWRSGTPVWTYSFAGYAFFPPLVLAYSFRGIPLEAFAALATGHFSAGAVAKLLLAIPVYGLPLAMLVASVVKVSRRDWILVSLMLLPLAVLGIWAYTVERTGDLLVGAVRHDAVPYLLWDRSMALLCTALGVAAAAFVRMRARLVRGVAVVLIGMVLGGLVVRSLNHGMGWSGFVGVCVGLFLLLMSPLVVHRLLGRDPAPKSDPREVHVG